MAKTFSPGDKVFAKVRGYPPWPARVESMADATPNKLKYHVFFYGTSETAVCKVEDLFLYSENKEKYGRPLKRKGFNEALAQIEGTAPVPQLPQPANVKATEGKVAGDDADSDAEGNLVIDERPRTPANKQKESVEEKRKVMKRKREPDATPDDVEVKRGKRGSIGGQRRSVAEQRTVDNGLASPTKAEVVSRSGRKIKPKKFADEETFDSSPPENAAVPPGKAAGGTMEGASVRRRQSAKAVASDGETNVPLTSSESAEKSLSSGGGVRGRTRILTAKTKTGDLVEISLAQDRPKNFESEKARETWEKAVEVNATRLKMHIERGDVIPPHIQAQIDHKIALSDTERDLKRWDHIMEKKKGKLRWLKIEARMVEVDSLMKGHLSITKANPERCLQLLDEMSTLTLDPLMLKKHPQVVETIKRLRKYIGNADGWGFNDEEKVAFSSKAHQIRTKAEHVYNKFKAMFTVPEGCTFWQAFSDDVSAFQKVTQSLPMDKVYSLVVDPVTKRSPKKSTVRTEKKPESEEENIPPSTDREKEQVSEKGTEETQE